MVLLVSDLVRLYLHITLPLRLITVIYIRFTFSLNMARYVSLEFIHIHLTSLCASNSSLSYQSWVASGTTLSQRLEKRDVNEQTRHHSSSNGSPCLVGSYATGAIAWEPDYSLTTRNSMRKKWLPT